MRNTNSYFSMTPTVSIGRTRFDMPHRHLTTANAGQLVPCFLKEVLPGDTWKMDVSLLARMSTLIHPTMDNLYLDLTFFYVPERLCWDHFKEFMGESPVNPFQNPIDYLKPQLRIPESGFSKGSIGDHFGLPTFPISYFASREVDATPFRAFSLIWQEWWRDENLDYGLLIQKGDATIDGVNDSSEIPEDYSERPYIYTTERGGPCPPVNKFHDYFTSSLPEPLRGDDVLIPFENIPIEFVGENVGLPLITYDPGDGSQVEGNMALSNGVLVPIPTYATDSQVDLGPVGPSPRLWDGVFANSSLAAPSINDLRLAVATQQFLEASALYGNRYTELLRGMFGVIAPDASLQRPEYLGGKRIRVNVAQVLQTSSTDEISPQGNVAGYSVTGDKSELFTKSFTEHGWLIGCFCIRNENTYQQGINKLWKRKDRLDYYWPKFANLGNQPVMTTEIYADSPADSVFGYQEYAADYRYNPSVVTGAFRSDYAQTLDSWHYADFYESMPYLSSEWLKVDPGNVDRTLAVQSSLEDQFLCDFYFDAVVVRPMPAHSVPGLRRF